MILDDLIANDLLPAAKRFVVRNALLLKHLHPVCLTVKFWTVKQMNFHSTKKNFIDICIRKKSKSHCLSLVR